MPRSGIAYTFPRSAPERRKHQIGDTIGGLPVVGLGHSTHVWLEGPCGHRFLYDARNMRDPRNERHAPPRCRECRRVAKEVA